MDLSRELKKAIGAAETHLFSNQQTDGRIHGACAGRAIETALAVHLYKGMEDRIGHSERLLSFCANYLADKPAQRSSANEFCREISKLLVSATVPSPDRIESRCNLESVLGQFDHPSKQRKRVLYSVLLAEVGVLSFGELNLSQDDFDYQNNQSWTNLVMLAAKAIYGLTTNAFTISDQDLLWLTESQSEDGSWDCHMFAGIIILIALKKTGRFAATIERGLSFIEQHIRPDGGVPFVPDVDCWITSLSGIVLSRGNQTLHSKSMADYIRKAQFEDGGWGFRKGLRGSDVDDTSFSVMLLQLANQNHSQPAITKGFRAILDFQNPDGGFTTYVRGAPSEVEVTAHAIMALGTAHEKYDASIESACSWLASVQGKDGSFRSEWVDTHLYSVSQVLFALNALETESSPWQDVTKRGKHFLLNQQNSDGGWGKSSGCRSSALSTAYALIGLLSCDRTSATAAVVRGIRYLLTQQNKDGAFHSEPDALGPRPLVFDIPLFSTIYSLWALYEMETNYRQFPKTERFHPIGVS
ncbi:MAG: hypothetical protein SynsKO_33420 [Synoicihabitans sp.]